MTLYITGFYAAALALLALALSIAVTMVRAKSGVSILHGDDMNLAVRIRRHGNLTEVVPLALILLGIAELGGAAPAFLYAAGTALLVGRIVHPLGMSATVAKHPLRIAGGMLTNLSIVGLIILIVSTRLAA